MTPLHFLGSVISHMAGASVGREGVVLLMASGLVRAFQLNWSFWGPVAMGCGFSAILGNPWIGLIFVWELLSTNVRQKIYVLMSSYFAYLLMQMLQVQHLISPIDIQQDVGVLTKFGFIFALALTSGFLMRLYKWVYLRASTFFQGTTITTRILISFILVGIFLVPEFRKYQSLGLLQLENLNDLQIGFHIPLIKLTLTLFSVTLGFWGGEFIPLIYSGLHFGASLAQFMGFNQLIGTYLGCYLFFAGATRLKWTGFFLLLSLMGFSWLGWLLLLMNLTVGFSGSGSLYQSNE